jgi:Rha family phage regulatory protein
MNELQIALSDLQNIEGVIKVSSLQIAERFGRRIGDVNDTIERLECSEEFNVRNYSHIFYKDSMNRDQKCYEMTKDGMALLVMGFTGAKASAWKEAYINAFNEMADELVTLRIDSERKKKTVYLFPEVIGTQEEQIFDLRCQEVARVLCETGDVFFGPKCAGSKLLLARFPHYDIPKIMKKLGFFVGGSEPVFGTSTPVWVMSRDKNLRTYDKSESPYKEDIKAIIASGKCRYIREDIILFEALLSLMFPVNKPDLSVALTEMGYHFLSREPIEGSRFDVWISTPMDEVTPMLG